MHRLLFVTVYDLLNSIPVRFCTWAGDWSGPFWCYLGIYLRAGSSPLPNRFQVPPCAAAQAMREVYRPTMKLVAPWIRADAKIV